METKNWNNDMLFGIYDEKTFLMRSGWFYDAEVAGVFAVNNIHGDGEFNIFFSFNFNKTIKR